MSELEVYIREFKTHLEQSKKEQSTIKVYLNELQQFFNWLEEEEKVLSQVEQQDLVKFRNHLLKKGLRVSTVNKWVSIISSFFKWALRKNYVTANYAEHIRIIDHSHEQTVKWLSIGEEEKLIDLVSRERNILKRKRNVALIYLMLYVGLKVDSIAKMPITSFQEDWLVIQGKNENLRTVPLSTEVLTKVSEWIDYRVSLKQEIFQKSPYLFVTERSGQMQARSIQFVIENYSGKLGFPITPQMLRHTFCRRLIEKGMPLQKVQELAGHKSILTTYQYVEE